LHPGRLLLFFQLNTKVNQLGQCVKNKVHFPREPISLTHSFTFFRSFFSFPRPFFTLSIIAYRREVELRLDFQRGLPSGYVVSFTRLLQTDLSIIISSKRVDYFNTLIFYGNLKEDFLKEHL